jgi:hypothetical protein
LFVQVRDLRGATSRKEKVLRRAAILLDEYKFSLEQAYFKAEKRTIGADKGATEPVAAASSAEAAKHRRASEKSAAVGALIGAGNEVVEIIAQNEGMRSALKRLSDVLTPFLNEENNDVSNLEIPWVLLQHIVLLYRHLTQITLRAISIAGGDIGRAGASAPRTGSPHALAAPQRHRIARQPRPRADGGSKQSAEPPHRQSESAEGSEQSAL